MPNDPRLWLYTLWQVLLSPIEGVRQSIRFLSPKRHQEFVQEAWTCPVQNLGTGGFHVVLVGPTIGEYRIMAAVADALVARRPEVRVTFCLRDKASIARILTERPATSVGYRPVDFLPIVARWQKKLKPDMTILVEGMRFPVLAWATFNSGSKNVLINGRCPARNKLHHRLRAPYFRWLFRPFDAFFFQSETHLKNAKPWLSAGQRAGAYGDLKLALPFPEVRAETLRELAVWLAEYPEAPIFVAGSTESLTEERLVWEAFQKVRASFPCRLVIAPRILSRSGELQSLTEVVSFRSQPKSGTDLFVLDTLGELNAVYALSIAAYIGGSLEGNGHNVFEAVPHGIPVTYGPKRGHFEAMQRLCEEQGVGMPVQSSNELAKQWERTLSDATYRDHVRAEAKALVAAQSAPLASVVDAIVELIDDRTTR